MTIIKKKLIPILFILFAFMFISCSDDSGSNPTASEQVNYRGLNSMNKEVLLSIVGDKVTGYSIEFEIKSTNETYSGKRAQTNTQGFTTVVSNKFSISLETNEVISGTISGNTITGSFFLTTGRTVNGKNETVSGTYTVEKL